MFHEVLAGRQVIGQSVLIKQRPLEPVVARKVKSVRRLISSVFSELHRHLRAVECDRIVDIVFIDRFAFPEAGIYI